MNNSDAAEQLMRMSLNGVETTLRVTGAFAKETLALILAMVTAANNQKEKGKGNLKGSNRLMKMLASGKPCEYFSFKEEDLKKFVNAANSYGIGYCVLKNPKDCPDNLCEVQVFAEDAPKVTRFAERYGINTLTHRARAEAISAQVQAQDIQHHQQGENFVNELLGNEPPVKQEVKQANPTLAKTDSPNLSAPSSANNKTSAGGFSDARHNRPSVKRELDTIVKERAEAQTRTKSQTSQAPTHQQPAKGQKSKNKRSNTR